MLARINRDYWLTKVQKFRDHEISRHIFKAQIQKQQIQQIQNVVPQVQQVQTQQKKSSEQNFWNTIANEIPNWQDINKNEAFQAWLLEVDPLTGINRQTYLEDAQHNLDANRVVNFFKTWEGEFGVAKSAQTDRKAQQSQLQKQVSPGKSRNNG